MGKIVIHNGRRVNTYPTPSGRSYRFWKSEPVDIPFAEDYEYFANYGMPFEKADVVSRVAKKVEETITKAVYSETEESFINTESVTEPVKKKGKPRKIDA